MAVDKAQQAERVSTRRWLGFVLGSASVLGPALASPDRPSSITGWALLSGSSIAAGLLTQSTLDEVASKQTRAGKEGRPRRRIWRSLTRRELLAWVLVLVVTLGCGSAAAFAVPYGWRMVRGCAEAVPVPVAATPSLGLPLQDVADAWMRYTTAPGGCPRYAVQVDIASDQRVLAALGQDWPEATADDAAGTPPVDLGPAPLVWFPDDHQSLNQARGTNPGLITSMQFYAGSAVGAVMSPDLRHALQVGEQWTWQGVAEAAASHRLHLVRPQPRASTLGRLAAHYLDAGDGPVAGRGPGLDDAAVAQAMCERSDVGRSVFITSYQAFFAAQSDVGHAPPGTDFSCWPDDKQRDFVSLTAGDPGGIERGLALLDQPGQWDRPSTSKASAKAAAAFVTWLLSDQGQQELQKAHFTTLPHAERAPVKGFFPATTTLRSGDIDDVAPVH